MFQALEVARNKVRLENTSTSGLSFRLLAGSRVAGASVSSCCQAYKLQATRKEDPPQLIAHRNLPSFEVRLDLTSTSLHPPKPVSRKPRDLQCRHEGARLLEELGAGMQGDGNTRKSLSSDIGCWLSGSYKNNRASKWDLHACALRSTCRCRYVSACLARGFVCMHALHALVRVWHTVCVCGCDVCVCAHTHIGHRWVGK